MYVETSEKNIMSESYMFLGVHVEGVPISGEPRVTHPPSPLLHLITADN